MKKYIKVSATALALGLTLCTGFSSCEDMLDPESDVTVKPEDNRLNSATDTLYSVIGIAHLMQNVADRTNLLGEVRADLSALTEQASTDLKELASFTAGKENIYNKIEDYYAIINNCNYFIENADSSFTKQGFKVFERELAVMHSFRAWAYLQLCINYGEVPFYTHFLSKKSDADEAMKSKKPIREIIEWLIKDLEPYSNTPLLDYEKTFNGYSSLDFTFPTKLMLADLNLWNNHYLEAAQYYHDFITDQKYPRLLSSSAINKWISLSKQSCNNNRTSVSTTSGKFLVIPMETTNDAGTVSQLTKLYKSSYYNNYFYEIGYSEAAVEMSARQTFTVINNPGKQNCDTVAVDTARYNIAPHGRLALGDLRLNAACRIRSLSSSYENYSTEYMENEKVLSSYISHTRYPIIYLHYAEALNRAGFPTAAFAVLKYGLSEKNTIDRLEGDPIAAEERDKAGNLLTFNPAIFDDSNNFGIHAIGSGEAAADTTYVIPAFTDPDSTMLWVEDKIIEELALETIFEGHRFNDLMRVALRRNDPAYLADPISKRNGEQQVDTELRNKLMDTKNWYLPY